MIDVFDIIAFIVFAVLIAAAVVIVVELGSLPGRIARKRGHPQAAAINVASWLGLVTGMVWLLALIWAFLKPFSAAATGAAGRQDPRPTSDPDSHAQFEQLQAQVDSLKASVRELQTGEGGPLMIAILVIIYTGIVLVLFKMKLVKPRPFPIACVVLAGVLLIGGVVVAWTLGAPISSRVVTTQYVVQLVPYVKGQVLKVHARANQPVKKGALLLEIKPDPYQYTVDQVKAQLDAAKENVEQARAGVTAAQANVTKSEAGVTQARAAIDQARASVANAKAAVKKATALDQLAQTEEKIALNLQKIDPGAISDLKVAKAVQDRLAKDAGLKQAEAGADEAEAGLRQANAGLGGALATKQQAEASAMQAKFALQAAQSNVRAVQEQLKNAEFDLTQCKMYAPADGFVVNWQVQEGTMLVPMPATAAGTFVDTSETYVAASFPQNSLMNVRPDDEVEFILDPYPGRLFKGKVDKVIPATGEGQFTPSGKIPEAAQVGSKGLLAVKIRLDEEGRSLQLPLGAGGTVAIYTQEIKPVHVITKVVIRMKKWLSYVVPS